MSAPGSEGGFSGFVWSDEHLPALDVEPPGCPEDLNDEQYADDTLYKIANGLRVANKKESSTTVGMVTEILHMMLLPEHGTAGRLGLGATATPPCNSSIKRTLRAFLRRVHATGRLPYAGQHGLMVPVPKIGGQATGMKASRWVALLCHLWAGHTRECRRRVHRP